MKLILVRHGRTIANVMGALDTAFPGNPLDAVGLAQAQSLPARLDEAGLLETVGSLWVSPIERARQTIAPVERATGLVATIRSGLREVLLRFALWLGLGRLHQGGQHGPGPEVPDVPVRLPDLRGPRHRPPRLPGRLLGEVLQVNHVIS